MRRTSSHASKSKATWYVLVLILGSLAVWRGWGLWHRGLLEHDEGHALLHANTYRNIMLWVLDGGPFNGEASIGQLRDSLHKTGGTLYSAGKSGHSLLLSLTGIVTGVSQGLGLFLAWIAGLLLITASGFLSYAWSGKQRIAYAIASVGLAFSPLVGYLSREVSGTIWALALATTGLAILTIAEEGFRRRTAMFMQVLSGLLFGFAFTCHFNIAPFIAAAFLAHGLYLHGHISNLQRQWSRIITKVLIPALAAASVLMVFQLATLVADHRLANAYPEFLTFFGELHRLFFADQVARIQSGEHTEGVIGWGWDAWKYYGLVLGKEGIVFCVLLVLSLVHAIKQVVRHPRIWQPALVLFLIPAMFWLIFPFKVERVLGMCVAPAWILVGCHAASYWHMLNQKLTIPRRKQAVFLLGTLCFLQVLQVTMFGWVDLWRQRSPLREVSQRALVYANTHSGFITAGSFNTGFAPLWKWAIIEEVRKQPEVSGVVDFSRFDGATVIFTDPATWRFASADFPVTQDQIHGAYMIESIESHSPTWTVSAFDISRRQ